jgi:ERCC4-type nuclease
MTAKIICDSRELRSGVPTHLEDFGCELQIETMEVGDYCVSDRVCFERKATNDFLSSWIDEKKLFSQLHDLAISYEKPILLIEGFENELYTSRRIDPRAVQGCLNTIAIMGIPTLYSISPTGSAKIISMIAEKEQSEEHRLPQMHGKRSHLTPKQTSEYIISAIPGIGRQTAIDLLIYFGTIEAISRAGISELMCVDGIGEKTACAIRSIVTENYNRS